MTDVSSSPGPVVGILAVQGDFAAHETALQGHGLRTQRIRRPAHLVGLAGLVLPGGESTTMLRLLDLQGLATPLRAAVAGGLPVLATCAGMILLARGVIDPEQSSLDLLDIDVARNGYGRQIHSGTIPIEGEGLPPDTTGVFIRAPRLCRVGPDVQVLARRGDDPVLVRQGAILAACFHPELQRDHPVIRMFVERVERDYGASNRSTPGIEVSTHR